MTFHTRQGSGTQRLWRSWLGRCSGTLLAHMLEVSLHWSFTCVITDAHLMAPFHLEIRFRCVWHRD